MILQSLMIVADTVVILCHQSNHVLKEFKSIAVSIVGMLKTKQKTNPPKKKKNKTAESVSTLSNIHLQ